MTTRVLLRGVVAALAVAAVDRPVLRAQGGPPQGREILTASANAGISTLAGGSGADNSKGRVNSDAGFSLAYRPGTPFVDVQAGASSNLRYNADTGTFQLVGHNASVNAGRGFALGARTSVQLSANGAYVAQYVLVPFPVPFDLRVDDPDVAIANPAAITPEALNFSVARRGSFSQGASASLSHQLTKRTSMTGALSWSRRTFSNAKDPGLSSANVSFRMQHQINRFMGAHLGYGRRLGNYTGTHTVAAGEAVPVTDVGASGVAAVAASSSGALAGVPRAPATIDDLDFGLDMNGNKGKAFMLGRRTTLDFGTGSAMTTSNRGRHVTFTGNATLNYVASRRQNITLDYRRGVDLAGGFGEPVFSDAITLRTGVRLASRLQLSASSTYSGGYVGTPGQANANSSATGQVQMSYGFVQRGNAYVSYSVFRHRIGANVDMLAAAPRYQMSQSVSGGLSYALPLLRDEHPRPRRPGRR